MLSPTMDHAPAGAPLGFVRPLLPKLVSEPPTGDGWLHEIKHDGHRTILVIDDGRVRAFTRNGHDWTDRYQRVVGCAAGLPCQSAILDGEMIVQDERGVSDFPALRRAMAREPHRLGYFAFDLMHLNGVDLRSRPLVERRALLLNVLGANDPFCPIQFSEAYAGDSAAVFAVADRMGLEGIVSKRADSKYRSGSSTAWLKIKCMTEGEFIVIGTERNLGGPPFALLAHEDVNGLTYVGSAFVTLGGAARDAFWSRAAELAAPKPALRHLRKKDVTWCRPELRVRVRHLRGSDMLRHASVAAVLS